MELVRAGVICEVETAAVGGPRGVAGGLESAAAANFVVDTGITRITAENTSDSGSLLDNKVLISVSDEIFWTDRRA